MDHSQETPGLSRGGSKPLDREVWRAWQEKNRLEERQRAVTRMKTVKWLCIAILIVTAVLFSPLSPYHAVVRFTVAFGALVVMMQELQTRRYAFAVLFAALLLLYNPFVPTFAFSGHWQRLLVFASVLPFLTSLIWLQAIGRVVSAQESQTMPV